MNNILKIFTGTLRRLKLALLIGLVCGAAGIALYFPGRATADFGNPESKIDVAVIDNEQSELSAAIKNYLSEKVNMNIIEENPEKFNDMLINTDISAIIEIPNGLMSGMIAGKDVKVNTTTLDDYENGAYIGIYIDSFMQSAAVAAKAANGDEKMFVDIVSAELPSKLETVNAVTSSREGDYAMGGFGFSSGFLVMLIFGVSVFVTLGVMDDKIYGTYNRMRASSVTGIQYIIGTLAAAVIVTLLVSMPLSLFMIISGAELEMSYLNIVAVNILFSLLSAGLAVLLALLINTKQSLFMLSGCIASIGAILGGAFFPVQDGEGILRIMSLITPHYWYMQVIKNNGEAHISMIILTLYTAVIFLASAVIFSKRSKS